MAGKLDMAGLAQLIRKTEAQTGRALNLRPVTEKYAPLLGTIIIKSFRAEKSPNDEKWAPLKASTLAARRKPSRRSTTNRRQRPRKAGILRKTGQLFGSNFSKAEGPRDIEYGFGAKHGLFHQFGKGRMRRPFLPVGADGKPQFAAGPAARWRKKLVRECFEYIIQPLNRV